MAPYQTIEFARWFDGMVLLYKTRNKRIFSKSLNPPFQRIIKRKCFFIFKKINCKINSKIKSQINGKINSKINNKINSQINSKIHSKINSKIKSQINSEIGVLSIENVKIVLPFSIASSLMPFLWLI